MTEGDYGDLERWINAPHVAKWWDENRTVEQIADYYGPGIRGEDPVRYWIWEVNGRSVGLLPGLPDLRPPRVRPAVRPPRRDRLRLRDRRGGARRPRPRHQPAVGVPARHRRPGVRRSDGAVRRPRPPQHALAAGARQARRHRGDVVRRAPGRRPRRHGRGLQHRRAAGAGGEHDPRRHLGLDLPAVARRLLPQGPAAAPRARVRRLAADLDRDQRLLLLPATARPAGRSGARRCPTTSCSRSRAAGSSRT